MCTNIEQNINNIETDWRHVIKNYDGWNDMQNFLNNEEETFGENLQYEYDNFQQSTLCLYK